MAITGFVLVLGLLSLGAYGLAINNTPHDITGTYAGWQPVDATHGDALVSITNTGKTQEIAHCLVSVKDASEGQVGIAQMNEPIGPGASLSGKVVIAVPTGVNVTGGTVTNC